MELINVYDTNLKTNINDLILDAGQVMNLRKIHTPNYRYINSRLMGMNPDHFTDMEYDLSEHGRIIDTDSIINTAFKKKRQAIVKEGFDLVSETPRNLAYIKQRLEDFEIVTGQSFESLLDEIVENLVNFNNCFLLKYRKESLSRGKEREANGRTYKPIAGLYVLAAPTIDTANNNLGQIIKYRHRIRDDLAREFKAEDILHIYFNKRTGITMGTPPLEPVRDDVYALRNIEQSTENMIYRNASPFIHVKVGDKESPAKILSDGTTEVDIYADIIDNMHESGGVATPHRVNIELKGAESQAMRLESYLTYFLNRVLTGISVSKVDLAMGDSTTGGAAAIISQALKDDVRGYQSTIKNFLSNYLFTELLLEAPFYSNSISVPVKERVYLEFIENDIDTRIKLETHYLNMTQGGLITKEFASKFIYKMTKKDIQEEEIIPTAIPAPKINKQAKTQKANSNILKKSGIENKAKIIKDSDISFEDKNLDKCSISNLLIEEGLQDIINYDILDSIYKQAYIFNRDIGKSFAINYLCDTIINYSCEKIIYD